VPGFETRNSTAIPVNVAARRTCGRSRRPAMEGRHDVARSVQVARGAVVKNSGAALDGGVYDLPGRVAAILDDEQSGAP
jgi:hypothetical protein